MAMICVPIPAILALGCQNRLADGIDFGTTKAPVISVVFVPAEYRALQAGMESLFEAPVRFNTTNAAGIAFQLNDGRWPYAILSAAEYASLPEEDVSKLNALAMGVFPDGQPTRSGVIVANVNSKVNVLADCRGKRFAFGPHKDLLLDYAARAALRNAGVQEADLTRELPPISITGRLNLGSAMDVLRIVAFDLTVHAGVVDAATFAKLPDTGGNFVTGPSKDMYRIIGTTDRIPGPIVLASPTADAVQTQKLQNFLLTHVSKDETICAQLGLKGFRAFDGKLYTAARRLIPPPPAPAAG
jgi:hypothetical protein